MPTESQSSELRMENQARYHIQVQGILDPSWGGRLGGLEITSTKVEGTTPLTTLRGDLHDQAALMGVLNTLYDLRLPLLSVQCLTY